MKKMLKIGGICLLVVIAFGIALVVYLRPMEFPLLPDNETVVVHDIVSGDRDGEAFSHIKTYQIEPNTQEGEAIRDVFSKYTYRRSLKRLVTDSLLGEKPENGIVPWYVEGKTFCWVNVLCSEFDFATAGVGEISLNGKTYTLSNSTVDSDLALLNEIRVLCSKIGESEK